MHQLTHDTLLKQPEETKEKANFQTIFENQRQQQSLKRTYGICNHIKESSTDITNGSQVCVSLQGAEQWSHWKAMRGQEERASRLLHVTFWR